MKAPVIFCIFTFFTLSPLAIAQTNTANPPAPESIPAAGAHIDSFNISSGGALQIFYSDGTVVGVPKERGRFKDGSRPLTQKDFSYIQIAEDHQHIGWFASYMVCQQANPCNTELVIYKAGHSPRYIDPPDGIMWRWKFLNGGSQAVVQFGPPHGKATGSYALFNTDTGDEVAEFFPGNAKAPYWVRQLK